MGKSVVPPGAPGVSEPVCGTIGRGVQTAVDFRMPALAALSAGADRLAAEGSIADALRAVAEAARASTGAELAILRVVEDGALTTRGVAGPSFLTAEIVGSRTSEPPPQEEVDDGGRLPAHASAIAARLNAAAVLVVPVRHDDRVTGSLELYRTGSHFDELDRQAARLTAAQAALA